MIHKDIVDLMDYDQLCQNYKNSGVTTIKAGDVVVIDPSNLIARCIKHSTTIDDPLVRGIAIDNIAPTVEGRIVIKGRVKANIKTGTTAIAIGNKLGTSATAGKLDLVTNNPICIALESVPASTEKTIIIEVK